MKILDANSWSKKNQDKFPNGSSIDKIMKAYAEYYHNAMMEVKTEKKPKSQ